jgi:hypothetical protein
MQINLVERRSRGDQILEAAQSAQDFHQHLYEDKTGGVCPLWPTGPRLGVNPVDRAPFSVVVLPVVVALWIALMDPLRMSPCTEG